MLEHSLAAEGTTRCDSCGRLMRTRAPRREPTMIPAESVRDLIGARPVLPVARKLFEEAAFGHELAPESWARWLTRIKHGEQHRVGVSKADYLCKVLGTHLSLIAPEVFDVA